MPIGGLLINYARAGWRGPDDWRDDMKNVLALGILIASGSAATGLAAEAPTPNAAHAAIPESAEARRYDEEAAALERKADAFAWSAKQYAWAGKPATNAQAKYYADVSDRYRAKAAHSRELAANARRAAAAVEGTPRD
jgi:hypothetical protein